MDCSEENVDYPDQVSDESTSKRNADEPSKCVKKLKTVEENRKVFQHKWLQMNRFGTWLEAVPGNKYAAKCRCCGVILNGGKSDLDRHAKTTKHLKNVKSVENTKPASEVLVRKSSEQVHEENVNSMEIQLSTFFAEHNLAFLQADHLVGVIKKGARDSAIARDVKLGSDKCTAIVKNVIAKVETEELDAVLKETLFSVMIDESTDISNKKNMCILVRYVSTSLHVVTRLLEIVQLDAHDTGADALWKAFTDCLDQHGIPITNTVGLACDNAAVMTGVRASFWTKLKAACPWAILINCICHTSAIISRSACSMLPQFVESHLRSVSSYMNGSPKRCAELRDFQELYEEEIQKVLRFSTTRWLVMHPCVQRYIMHRESLLGFFRTKCREDPKDREAAILLQDMNNPFTLAYLYFLEYALDAFNQFNAMFQSREILVHKLSDSSRKLLKNFCQNFIVSNQLNNLDTLNLSHPSNFLPLERMYLGPKCANYLTNLQLPPDPEKKKTPPQIEKELKGFKEAFLLKCLAFYSKAAVEMKARLPTGKIFQEMCFLEPSVLLSAEKREELPYPNALASNFKEQLNLDENNLAIEWRTIPNEIEGSLRVKLLAMSVQDAWVEISHLKNFNGEHLFPQLSKLAHCVLSLPHSNAEAERIFSIVTDVKNKKRNRMGAETLNALAVVRSSFASKGITCSSFQVTEAHLQKFNSGIYKN